MRPSRRALVGATTLLVLAVLWYFATTGLGLISAGRFPAPGDVEAAAVQAFGRGYPDATLLTHVLHSLRLVAFGFSVSVALGVPVGMLMGWSRTAEALINPVFSLLRPIPPLAWIPLAILWLGLGDGAKVMVIVLAAFPPAVISTHAGVRTVAPSLVEAAQMLGTPRPRFVVEVLAPAAAPMIFTGLRLSLQASWTTLVAAELVGSLAGLGYVLNVAQQDLYPGMILVGMAAVGLLGAGSTALLGFAERRAIGWAQIRGGGGVIASRQPLPLSRSLVLGAAGTLAFLGLWAALARSGLVPRLFLPGPFEVAARFAALLATPFAGGTLLMHLASSLQRFLAGFCLAAVVGVPLGLTMGWSRLLDDIVTPVFDALRFIAPIAWVPFAALWFGTGIGGPILIIFAGAFPPCLINAYRGARYVDARLLEAAAMLGTPGHRVVTEVMLPGALPSIVAGLRVSAGLGWQSLVGAELIVASTGVGYMMVQAQGAVSTTTVMAGMAAIGLVGVTIDAGLRAVEARIRAHLGQA